MNPTITYIAKRLSNFVYKPLSGLYEKWNSKIIWDEELIRDLMEYFKLDHDDIIHMLKSGTKLQYDFWNELNQKTEEEILKFYETVPYSIFGLASWHMTRRYINFRNEILKYCSGDVLEYGRRNWGLVCENVIEHIPHPKIVLERMARHLRNNGRLIITKLNFKGEESNPLHCIKKDFDGEKLLNELGLVKEYYDWLWIKKSRLSITYFFTDAIDPTNIFIPGIVR